MKNSLSIFPILFTFLMVGVSLTAHAALHTEKVQYKQGDTDLVGYLAYDDSTASKRPGVLVVHEWWGLTDYEKRRAELLAQEGYIAFALDMYGGGKTTDHPKEAGEWATYIMQNSQVAKERFLAGYEFLKNHRMTHSNAIAAIGYCFGGYIVLATAQEGVDLRGVVSFHGGLPDARVEPNTIKAKILVCHGAEDATVKQEQLDRFMDNLRYAKADWQVNIYSGAKHGFTNPAADSHGIPVIGYNAEADRRSWKAMLTFFEEIFGE
jgi:dienelactone hydrolase